MSRSAIRRMLFAAVAIWAVAMTAAAPSPAQAQWQPTIRRWRSA